MRTLAFGHHEDRTPTDGYAATREAVMAAFAKSRRRAGPGLSRATGGRLSGNHRVSLNLLANFPNY
jgi:hypothetical protein